MENDFDGVNPGQVLVYLRFRSQKRHLLSSRCNVRKIFAPDVCLHVSMELVAPIHASLRVHSSLLWADCNLPGFEVFMVQRP